MAPERLGTAAKAAEDAGFDEVWVSEDFFFSGGIAGAGLALAATREIRVGLGVVSAVVRHPAQLAMELATLARAYPGRFMPGIGLGVPAWMDQMGLDPASPVTAIRECVTIVRALLDGDELDVDGRMFSLRHGRLDARSGRAPPDRAGCRRPEAPGAVGLDRRWLGAVGALGVRTTSGSRGARSMRVARRLAGPTPIGSRPLRSTRCRATAAAARRAARETLAFYAAAGGTNALTEAAGISAEPADLVAEAP